MSRNRRQWWHHATLQMLAHPVVIVASGFMVFVEFFADKIRGLGSLWDSVHIAIRIPAGAALAASVFRGGHAAIATVAAINTSPEPFSSVGTPLVEDGLVPGGMCLAWRCWR